ncbi:MAG: peptidase, partial [Flavobacteriaceae bacterium]
MNITRSIIGRIALLLLSISPLWATASAPQPYSGFFNFYYLPDADKIHLEITNLGEEFLYINSLSSGIGNNDIGLDRGQLGNERIVKFQRAGNKVLLVQPNYR